MKGTGWVGLQLSIIFTQAVGWFNMWVTPYTGKVALLLIQQGDIQSVEQGISSAKVKPDMSIQKFD